MITIIMIKREKHTVILHPAILSRFEKPVRNHCLFCPWRQTVETLHSHSRLHPPSLEYGCPPYCCYLSPAIYQKQIQVVIFDLILTHSVPQVTGSGSKVIATISGKLLEVASTFFSVILIILTFLSDSKQCWCDPMLTSEWTFLYRFVHSLWIQNVGVLYIILCRICANFIAV